MSYVHVDAYRSHSKLEKPDIAHMVDHFISVLHALMLMLQPQLMHIRLSMHQRTWLREGIL